MAGGLFEEEQELHPTEKKGSRRIARNENFIGYPLITDNGTAEVWSIPPHESRVRRCSMKSVSSKMKKPGPPFGSPGMGGLIDRLDSSCHRNSEKENHSKQQVQGVWRISGDRSGTIPRTAFFFRRSVYRGGIFIRSNITCGSIGPAISIQVHQKDWNFTRALGCCL